MKIIAPGARAVLLIMLAAGEAWASGPHGTSQIGDATDLLNILPIYQNITAPLYYPSLTRRDVVDIGKGKEVIDVEGRSAKIKLFIPTGYFLTLGPIKGFSLDVMDRSVQKAIADARERYGVELLYDIRIDKKEFSILGIYNTTTTIIHAKGIK